MEGAYNRVLSARQAVPHETYVYFMDLLAKTVRYDQPIAYVYEFFDLDRYEIYVVICKPDKAQTLHNFDVLGLNPKFEVVRTEVR